METANEGEGDSLAKSTTASEEIREGPNTRDSENHDSPIKEDTLQQLLTCETGNTGTEASTPPCDKGTGQGLHDMSPDNDNLDKVQDDISLIQLEARSELAETSSLQRHMELEDSDESGDWETASEASVAFEEITDIKKEKPNESLESDSKIDVKSQEEIKDHLKVGMCIDHLGKTDINWTEEQAENLQQSCDKAHGEDLWSQQAFTPGTRPQTTDTVSEESLSDPSRTESVEISRQTEEALGDVTVSEESDASVEKMDTDHSLKGLSTKGSLTDSELPDIESVNEWTHEENCAPEDNGFDNEEVVTECIMTPMEETVKDSEPPNRKAISEATAYPADKMEQTIQQNMESPEVVVDREDTVPDGDGLVRLETGPYVAKILDEQCSPPMEDGVKEATQHPSENELVSLQILKDQCNPPIEDVVSDGTLHHSEEVVGDHAMSNAEETASEVNTFSANSCEPHIEERLSGMLESYLDERDSEGTSLFSDAHVNDGSGLCVGETDYSDSGDSDNPNVEANNEKNKSMSDHTLGSDFGGRYIDSAYEDNIVYDTDEEQGQIDISTSREALDGYTDAGIRAETVDNKPTINKGSNVDENEPLEDEIATDLTDSVQEEAAYKMLAPDHKKGQQLDEDTEGEVSKETEEVHAETVGQEQSGVSVDTTSIEPKLVYTESDNQLAEGAYKDTTLQVTSGPFEETVNDETLRAYIDIPCKKTDDGSNELLMVEASPAHDETCRKSVAEDVYYRDTVEYETPAYNVQVESDDCMESVEENPTVDHRDMVSTLIEPLLSECMEIQSEVTSIIKETTEQGRPTQDRNDIFVGENIIDPSKEETTLTKQSTEQESVAAMNIPSNIQTPIYVVKGSDEEEHDSDKIWHAKETELKVTKEQIEHIRLEDDLFDTDSGEIDTKTNNLEAILLSKDLQEDISHNRLFNINVDQAVSIKFDFPDMDVDVDTVDQVPLDETIHKETEEGESDESQSLNVRIPDMLLEPIAMKPINFSVGSFRVLDVVNEPEEPNTQHLQVMEEVKSLHDFYDMDTTNSLNRQLVSPQEEIKLKNLDPEHIKDVIQEEGTVEHQGGTQFSGMSEQAEDKPDCFSQGLDFDKGFKNSTFLPQTDPFAQPKMDTISLPDAALTVAAIPVINILPHGGPIFDDHDQAGSEDIHTGHQEVDEMEVDRLPLLITRQRSKSDPCISYDQGEKHSTQLDEQNVKEKPRPRLRSVTPPLDNYTSSFTATSPQALLDKKPLEKPQPTVVLPEVDYDISEEKEASEATPKKEYTFFPTQIFNPLFFIQESTGQEQEPFVSHSKESINKRRMPSPPRDTEVLLKVQQPPTITRPSSSFAISKENVSTDPAAPRPVNPVWHLPRPLRHSESAVGRDIRNLKPTENPLVRRPTIRHKRGSAGGPALRGFGAMNLPTIPQEVPSGETSSLEKKSSRTAGTRSRPLPRQIKVNEQDESQPKSRSPMERLAEAEESFRKTTRNMESVALRGKRSQAQPPASDSPHTMHRRYSTLFNSYSLTYQEYSDVALNQEIQRQKPSSSPAEEKDPGSPRQRRRILSSQDSYLQRLSISSADSLWQDLPKIRDSVTFMSMSREEQKLQEAKFELIMSEALYVRSLNIAVDHFYHSQELQKVLSPQDRQWLFSRIAEVRDASNDFLFDLEEEFENNMYNFQVSAVVISHEPNFRKVYLPYVTNQSYQDQTFQRLMNDNPRFQQVVSKLESDPVCQRLTLKSFLILPFQRITRLRLLLQNILKRSAPASTEELQATEAHNAIEKLIRDCNEGVQKMKDTEELIRLHQRIQFECKIFPLISASRRLVKHGEVTSLEFHPISFKWKGTTRQVYLHLFSDCLLLSRIREGGRFVVFDHASDFRVERCEIKLHSNQKNIFRVFLRDSAVSQARDSYTEGQEIQYIFRTETQSQKLRWIHALSPPREEIDLLRDGLTQVQCLKSYKARENDELSLEKADILMVIQGSDDGWICGARLSDLQPGWFPQSQVQYIDPKTCLRNLLEEQRLQNARAKLHPSGAK